MAQDFCTGHTKPSAKRFAGLNYHDSMSTVEFLIELEEHFEIEIPDCAAERMQTIRAITECIAELQSKRI